MPHLSKTEDLMVRIETDATMQPREFGQQSTRVTRKQMLHTLIAEYCYLSSQEGIAQQIGLIEACKRKWHGITTLKQLKRYSPPGAVSLSEVVQIVSWLYHASKKEKSTAKKLEKKIQLLQEANGDVKAILEKRLNNSLAIAYQNDKKALKQISTACLAGAAVTGLLLKTFLATHEAVCYTWKK